MTKLRINKFSVLSLVLFTFTVFTFVGPVVYAAGFREFDVKEFKIGVWYPSNQATKKQRLGPFDVNFARDAPINQGNHPIILTSHGNGGYYRNHHLTAQALADNGFIVVAPNHEADYHIGRDETTQALNRRYLDLSIALATIANDPMFENNVNLERVHGLGYSLGGATILLGAGATFNSMHSDKYCEENGRIDAEFCEAPNDHTYRILKSLRNDVELPETSDPFHNPPLINGNLVLVAPVTQGLSLNSLGTVKSLNILAIDGDVIAKPEFHAEPIFETAPAEIKGELWSIKGHHFAFIAPFPKRITDKEHIPVAIDPKGFDRSAFLENINNKIVALFLQN